MREPFSSQQLLVMAHYADGSTRDVTGIASYTSSEEGVATVGPDGRVAYKRVGAVAYADLTDEIERLLPGEKP